MDLEQSIPIVSSVDKGSTVVDFPNATEHPHNPHLYDDQVVDPMDPDEAEVVNIRQGNKVLRSLQDLETWMDRKLKFEAMGVERIPENNRRPPQLLNASASLQFMYCPQRTKSLIY